MSQPLAKLRARVVRNETGFTLVEVIIAVVLLGAITAAITASLLTGINASDSTTQQTRESNDAQIIAAFLVRDAQAAGGSDPATGTPDPSLGVFVGSDGGCEVADGQPIVTFGWDDPDGHIAHFAAYHRVADANELVRTVCREDTAERSTTVLGRQVTDAEAYCDGDEANDCTADPDVVHLAVTSQDGDTPYDYELTALLRPDRQAAPDGTNSAVVPLLALGSATCSGSPLLEVEGNTDVDVDGVAIVNTPPGSTCPAMSTSGSSTFLHDGTVWGAGGTCAGPQCPTPTFTDTRFPDPFEGLAPPPGSACSGPGSGYTWHGPTTVNVDTVFAPGVHIFCGDLRVNSGATLTANGVEIYFGAGTLIIEAQSTVVMTAAADDRPMIWQPNSGSAATVTIAGQSGIQTYDGIVYVPRAGVVISGGSDFHIGSIIAQWIRFAGGSNTGIGAPPPPSTPTTTTLPPGPTTTTTPPSPLVVAPPAPLQSSAPRNTVYSSGSFTISGGTASYTGCTVTTTGPGNPGTFLSCALSGASAVLSGTLPSHGGPNSRAYAVTVRVTDSAGGTGQYAYTLTAT
jgi:prepilin-type N-terminal cleavage/methylation domain-containing protein